MQLQRLVQFHKALSDPNRIRILTLLAGGPLHGQALAERLGMTPPTITHHMSKLRDVGLVNERRDKNTIYFYLNALSLRRDVQATLDVIFQVEKKIANRREGEEKMDETMREAREEKAREIRKELITRETMSDGKHKERETILRHFLTTEGRLKQIPVQQKKKRIVLEHLLIGFEMGRKYSEKEINEHIKRFHPDYATIRREFIIHHYMYRENGMYELNPPEMWGKTE